MSAFQKEKLKCPYNGLWKVHFLVLGVPNNRLACMQGQKTLSLSSHLFLPYLLNDSQTIRWMINFSKPLLCVTIGLILLCVQHYRGNHNFLPLQKRHLVAKNEFAFSFRPTQKDQQVGGLMFHVDGNANQLWIEVKKLFQWFSRLFHLSENNFMHGALSDLKLCRMFLLANFCTFGWFIYIYD